MAKCGHDVCPDDNCGLKYPFNGGRRARCRRIQDCIESRCSTLKALGPNGFTLYDACIGQCHDDGLPTYPANYASVDDYVCANFDPVTLADYFGVNPCLVPVTDTKVGAIQAAEEKANTQTKTYILGVGAIVLILLAVLFLD